MYFSSEKIGETLIPVVKATLFSPSTYFAGMPRAQGYRDSLVLLAIYLLVPALLSSLLSGVVTILFILPTTLIFGMLTTWLWAWYLAWAARRFCASTLTTEDAFQILAYSAVPLLFSWIPILGAIGIAWNLYLTWQGLVSYGKVGGGAALLIILAAFLILGLSLMVLFLMLAAIGLQDLSL